MKVYLATDHAGFELKEKVKHFLSGRYDVEDCGAHSFDKEDDYPDFISKAAEKISKHPEHKAIIFGGSGQGEAMAANRYRHVRATVFYGGSDDILKLSREHNDANILSIGARFVDHNGILSQIDSWLKMPFPGEERHRRRIGKF